MYNMLRYYNYIYLDPRKPGIYTYQDVPFIFKHEPFYIGKGTGIRSNKHLKLYDKKYSTGRFKKNLIKAILKCNLKPIVLKINNNISEFEAFENETFLIKKIGRRDLNKGPLTNMKDGDKGRANTHVSLETRLKMRNNNLGKKLSLETKKKLSDINKGKIITEEHRRKISEANKGRIFSNEHKSKLKRPCKIKATEKQIIARKRTLLLNGSWSNKKVLQLDLNNNIIQEFRSIKEAHEVLKLGKTYTGDRCRLHDLKIINNTYKLIFKHNDSKF